MQLRDENHPAAWLQLPAATSSSATSISCRSYSVHALACAESTARELIAEDGLDLAEVDLLIATASVPDFAAALGQRLGIRQDRVASLADGFAGAHTAAGAIARESVQPVPGTSRTALVVSAGAGITVVAAVHRT